MLKNIVRLEAKVGEKVYHLLCDNDSPINELKDALFEFLKFVGQVEDTIKAQKANTESPPTEQPPPEE